MMDIEAFRLLAGEILDELPEELFRELNLGVVVVDTVKLHPKAVNNDLYILGQYRIISGMGRGIELYYGSFMRLFGHYTQEQTKDRLRELIRHELRHHVESLAGETWLTDEDKTEIEDYIDRNEPAEK